MARPIFVLQCLGLVPIQLTACDGPDPYPKPGPPGTRVDSGFSVVDDAFTFPNFGGKSALSQLSFAEARRLFGADAVCIAGTGEDCVVSPLTKLWMEQVNRSMRGGRCEGFAVLSQLVFLGLRDSQEFGADPLGAVVSANNEAVLREIAYWFATQHLGEPMKRSTRKLGAKEAAAFLGQVLAAPVVDLWRIGIIRLDDQGAPVGGHAMTPFAIEPDPAIELTNSHDMTFENIDMSNAFVGIHSSSDGIPMDGNVYRGIICRECADTALEIESETGTVIEGLDATWAQTGLSLNQVSNVTVGDSNDLRAWREPLKITASNGITVEGVDLSSDPGSDQAVWVSDSTDVTLRGIFVCGAGAGVFIEASTRTLIERATLGGISLSGVVVDDECVGTVVTDLHYEGGALPVQNAAVDTAERDTDTTPVVECLLPADECSAKSDDCGDYDRCVDMRAGFACMCAQGARAGAGPGCELIDECAEETVYCPEGVECVDQPQGATCDCPARFEWSGIYCRRI